MFIVQFEKIDNMLKQMYGIIPNEMYNTFIADFGKDINVHLLLNREYNVITCSAIPSKGYYETDVILLPLSKWQVKHFTEEKYKKYVAKLLKMDKEDKERKKLKRIEDEFR